MLSILTETSAPAVHRRCGAWQLAYLTMAICVFSATAAASVAVNLVASSVPHVVDIQHAGDGTSRLFLVSKRGRVFIHDGSQLLKQPFLDLSTLVPNISVDGLLGLVFHPNYATNGSFFVQYVADSHAVIARYSVSADPNVADPTSGRILLVGDATIGYHATLGGQLRFGPDGFLYIALGDSSNGHEGSKAQRLDSLLGKLLRIDVDGDVPYSIPASNPFVATPGAKGEIWAYGLHDPHFSFDPETGEMFIADRGFQEFPWDATRPQEEVDFQPAGAGGRNYGWPVMMGRDCYVPAVGCDQTSLVLPILDYGRTLGGCVTGGFRYRGALMPELRGSYLFADQCGRRIWGAMPDASGTWRATELLHPRALTMTTFGEDAVGELYLGTWGDESEESHGALYRLIAAPARPRLTVEVSGKGRLGNGLEPVLDCGSICSAELDIGTIVYLYAQPGFTVGVFGGDPDCADGTVTLSEDRTCTAKLGVVFTNEYLPPGIARIRAVHIIELRTRIDSLRSRFGLSPMSWTDATLTGAVIRTVHVTELRMALAQVYDQAGISAPSYTDRTLVPGETIVKAAHIAELRSAVIAIE